MKMTQVLGILAIAVSSAACAADNREESPTLVVLRHDSKVDFARVFDAANREFLRARIAEYKPYVGNDRSSDRLRQELKWLEKSLSELKPTGKALPGFQYITVFEEPDCVVVAYFDSTRAEQFVWSLSKKDYSPLLHSSESRKAANMAGMIK